MDLKIVEKAAEIISAKRLDSIMALLDLDGYPTASTITVSKNDGIKWLTFCTGLGSNKTKRINMCNQACICFSSNEPLYNITLIGKIEVITDPEIKKEMWYSGLENHFSGPEDKNYCVLKFVTERYKLFVNYTEVEGKLQNNIFVMLPDKVAKIGYKALMKGKTSVIVGLYNKMLVFSSKIMPSFVLDACVKMMFK